MTADRERLADLCIFAVLGSRWEEGGSFRWSAQEAQKLRDDMNWALNQRECMDCAHNPGLCDTHDAALAASSADGEG